MLLTTLSVVLLKEPMVVLHGDVCFVVKETETGEVDMETKSAWNCGGRVKTGFVGVALDTSDVWTFTTPVLPPLVVTRIDCESRMHIVFSSCLAALDSLDFESRQGTELGLVELESAVAACESLSTLVETA